MNSDPKILSQQHALSAIEPILREISALEYDGAAGLAEAAERVVLVHGERVGLWIYREPPSQTSIRVVVQLAVDHGKFLLFFRHGQSFAEGLEFTRNGVPRRLSDDELYDYT